MMPSVPQLLTLLLLAVVVLVPPCLVIASPRSHGGAKFGWFLATLFFS